VPGAGSEIDCSRCGAANRAAAKFCSECGFAMSQACGVCGAPLGGGRFCSECGTPIPGRETGASVSAHAVHSDRSPSDPVSERRTASLLFADMVGFTPIAEARDPEAVRDLLATYFERARAIIERYNGTVEKFIGDAVFAVWGVPAAREDDAERAVRAGLDLVATARVLGEEFGVEALQMRVGVSTGQVAVTLGAIASDGQGVVAGDAVNTAARIQAVAAPGEVWVDDTTRSLTTASLAYVSTGSHELKGKSFPVELFHAVRTTAAAGGAQRVDGLEAPFVGRDRELRLVKELFHATAEERRVRLVLVAGEPGIGKSRLAWEFEKYADAITQRTHWLRGRCLSYGQGVAGRVVAEMVRSLLRVTETDDASTVAAALDERLARHVTDDQERIVLRPRLASLLGLSDAVFEQADLFACWRAFFESLCASDESVTVIVEDLQWADDGFLDFLDYLLEASRAPIMVIGLARPEVTARRAGIGAGRRSTTVFLEPLPDAVMERLLDGLVADLPADLRNELVARADGVPLYAVETVRALIDRDVVVASGGRYVVDPDAAGALDLSALGPPASLQALLAARLDALPAAERRVVQDASVLGLSFSRAGIGALAPPDIDLDVALESLRRKEILIVDDDPRSPERGQYRFVQALLRTSAYDTLSRRDRHARHLAAAHHLASLPDADTIAGVLAAHYLDALGAMPEVSDAAALRSRAAELLEQAAVHAVGVGAPTDAIAYYARLLELPLPDETVVRLTLAATTLAIDSAAQLDPSQRWLSSALLAAHRLGDEDAVLGLTLNQARVLQVRGLVAEGVVLAQEVFAASLGRPERIALLANAARGIAISAAQSTGEIALAEQTVLQALPEIERYGDQNHFDTFMEGVAAWAGVAGYRRFSMLIHRGAAGHADGRSPRSVLRMINEAALLGPEDVLATIRIASTALQGSEDLGLIGSRVAACAHLLIAYLEAGRWEEAGEILQRHAADGRTDRLDWETYLSTGSALYAYGRGEPTLMGPPAEEARDSIDPVVAGWLLMRDAIEAYFAGDRSRSAELAVGAVDRMSALGNTGEDLALAHGLAVDLLLEARDAERLTQLTESLEQVPLGQRYRLLHGNLLRARAHLSPNPVPGLRAAVEVFNAMGAAYPAARVRVELATRLADDGDMRGAADALAGARPLLEQIGATPLLAVADRVAATIALVVPVSP
jgi:class 3 adenylate cyclase/tetratricopeptide (TPR) repeat protein